MDLTIASCLDVGMFGYVTETNENGYYSFNIYWLKYTYDGRIRDLKAIWIEVKRAGFEDVKYGLTPDCGNQTRHIALEPIPPDDPPDDQDCPSGTRHYGCSLLMTGVKK